MATKRQKKNGNWEYIIKRSRQIGEQYSFTKTSEAEGDAHAAKLEAMLDAGMIPDEIKNRHASADLTTLIRAYLIDASVPTSDTKVLNVLIDRVGGTKVNAITYEWVEMWIEQMKVVLNLAPGTIRHYVGALGRCFDYAGRKNIASLIINPIRRLPTRYAQYTEKTKKASISHDSTHVAKGDIKRDRRFKIATGEEALIQAAMNRENVLGRQRPLAMKSQAALQLLFDLAVETCMRMREMFTLTLDQVVPEERTIFLEETKNGHKRQVPLSTVAVRRIDEYIRQVAAGEGNMGNFAFEGGRLFPWWDGDESYEVLSAVTSRLSGQYKKIFEAAGVLDFRFHDLRHEATSRLFEKTSLDVYQIMKITGHSSIRALDRYANLRGSHLAKSLW